MLFIFKTYLKISIVNKNTYVYYEYIKFLLKIFIYKIYNVHITYVSKAYIIKVKWFWYYSSCILKVWIVVMGLHVLIRTILIDNNY